MSVFDLVKVRAITVACPIWNRQMYSAPFMRKFSMIFSKFKGKKQRGRQLKINLFQ